MSRDMLTPEGIMEKLLLVRFSTTPAGIATTPFETARRYVAQGRFVLIDEEMNLGPDGQDFTKRGVFMLYPNITWRPHGWTSFKAVFPSSSIIGSRRDSADYVSLRISDPKDQTLIYLLERP